LTKNKKQQKTNQAKVRLILLNTLQSMSDFLELLEEKEGVDQFRQISAQSGWRTVVN